DRRACEGEATLDRDAQPEPSHGECGRPGAWSVRSSVISAFSTTEPVLNRGHLFGSEAGGEHEMQSGSSAGAPEWPEPNLALMGPRLYPASSRHQSVSAAS